VPADVEFATKPTLARQMIGRALDAGVGARWVAGDEVYGASTDLRAELEKRQVGYVLAIACDHQVATGAGKLRADRIAKQLPAKPWQRLSAGVGAKGPRWYDWALVDIDTDRPGHAWLLIRRNQSTGELAYYRCYAPHLVPLGQLVSIAGRRWTVEESFQAGKGLCGLDQHQVRAWTSWQRWTILAMTAHAFLAVLAAHERSTRPAGNQMIPLTCNEIKHLINALHARPPRGPSHCLRWAAWRRRRQHRSRLCHYRRRGAKPPEDHHLRLPY
jgi:SRSO17 transposase